MCLCVYVCTCWIIVSTSRSSAIHVRWKAAKQHCTLHTKRPIQVVGTCWIGTGQAFLRRRNADIAHVLVPRLTCKWQSSGWVSLFRDHVKRQFTVSDPQTYWLSLFQEGILVHSDGHQWSWAIIPNHPNSSYSLVKQTVLAIHFTWDANS